MRVMTLFVCVCAVALAGEIRLGKPLTQPQPVPIGKILSAPDSFVGKTVQVKGKVTEVCEMAGCWINLVDSANQSLRVKVNDGEIAFPQTSVGRLAIAEGKFVKFALTREQAAARAKHEAEEQGRKFDPASVKTGTTIYQIQGSGALILD